MSLRWCLFSAYSLISMCNSSRIPLPALVLGSVTHQNIQRLTASGKLLSRKNTSTKGHRQSHPPLHAGPLECITGACDLAMDHTAACAVLAMSLEKTEVPFQETGIWATSIQLTTFLVAQMVKNLSAMQETRVQRLGWEDPLEKGLATHSSILA